EFRVQAHDPWVHVGGRRLPPCYVRHERRVERDRHVVVRHVVEVRTQRQAPITQSDDLLRRQIELANARTVHVARRDQIDGDGTGRRQRTPDLRRGRCLVRRAARVGGEQGG